jgi:hypothetical protein
VKRQLIRVLRVASRFSVEEKLNGRFSLIAFIDLFREIDENGVEKSPGQFHGWR